MTSNGNTNVPLLRVASKVPHVRIAVTLSCNHQYADFSLALSADELAVAVPMQPNRMVLERHLGVPVQWLRQVHGTDVVVSTNQTRNGLPTADAAYVDATQLRDACALAVLTADCLPVVLYSEYAGKVEYAIIHAGWRSLAGGLISKTLAHFARTPHFVHAWLGPCVRQPSYPVGGDMRQAVLRMQPEWDQYFTHSALDIWHYDLAASAHHELTTAGVMSITDCALNSFTDTRFYSYRKEHNRAGRFATCVWQEADIACTQ